MLSEHDIDRLLREADPAEAPLPAGLSLDEAKRELLTGIVGDPPQTGRSVVVHRQRRRYVVAVGLACMAIGGTAVAAGIWSPGIGTNPDPDLLDRTPPTVAASAVPSAIAEVVGTLGREQTDADRDADIEAALGNLTSGADGVRLDSVRKLGEGVDGEATFLFSAEKTDGFSTAEEPVCLSRPIVAGEDVTAICFGLSQIITGNAKLTYDNAPAGVVVAAGLVPDGVVSVVARFGNAPDRTVAVHDNYFELALAGPERSSPDTEPGVIGTVWHDADGNVIPQRPGDGVPGRWPNGYPESVGWGY